MPRACSEKLVIGNWKMYGNTAENQTRLDALVDKVRTHAGSVKIAVCVPYPYLAQAQTSLRASDIAWGTQDISSQQTGAYTGEVSACMAAEFGSSYTIVGHSERRAYHGETSEIIAMKARQALTAGITPVVCIGETLEEREADMTAKVVSTQLAEILGALSAAEARQIVLAYEPVWAIGTGRTASPAQAQEVHSHIRRHLIQHASELAGTPILYGGSVKAANSTALFSEQDIDGALVGGASLDAAEFAAICTTARQAVEAPNDLHG